MMLLVGAMLVGPLSLLFVPAAGATDLEVTRLDGTLRRGVLTQLMPAVVLNTSDGEQTIPWSDVLSIRVDGAGAPATSSAPGLPFRFLLGDGSEFAASIEGATDRAIRVQRAGGMSGSVEPARLRSVVRQPAGEAVRAEIEKALKEPQRTEDVAVVARDARIVVLRGAVRKISADGLLINWNNRDVNVPWDRLGGLALAQTSEREAPNRVRLRGGDTLAGAILGGDSQSVRLRTESFDVVELRWSEAERIDCRSRRLIYLSDVAPNHYEHTPLIRKRWMFAADRTLTGRPLRLSGQPYEKGITMRSRSQIVYAIGGGFSRFSATVGIVDEMGRRGDAVARVLGDGKLLWEARRVRGGEPPIDAAVDIAGVRELTLEVDYGEDLDLSDHVCWAAARLVR